MSNDGTNTPNGDSKNLYVKNEDLNRITVGVVDIMELDPQRDVAENSIPPEGLTIEEGPGSNTAGGPGAIINNTEIRDFGFVAIQAIGIGELVNRPTDGKPSPEVLAAITAAQKELSVKRGAISFEAYVAQKIKKNERDTKGTNSKEDDKDDKTENAREQEG